MFAEIPLLTTMIRKSQFFTNDAVLTRNMRAGSKLLSHSWIHGDHDLLLVRH